VEESGKEAERGVNHRLVLKRIRLLVSEGTHK
jgi:hypothetical protein